MKASDFVSVPVSPALPFDIDVNFVFIFDTSSFRAEQREQAKAYTRRFIAEFRIKHPTWQGQVFEYEVGDENWLKWATTYGKDKGLKKVVIISFIDESHPIYHSNSTTLTTEPTATFIWHHDVFVANHPYYDYFKMVVYAVPAGYSTPHYVAHQLQVYCAVEGEVVLPADFKQSYQGDISLITQENKHKAAGIKLKDFHVSEFHGFPTTFGSMPYEVFKEHMNEAVYG